MEARGYSIEDDIIVLPSNLNSDGDEMFTEANFEAGTPSPYYPFMEKLYSELGYLFLRAGLISEPRGRIATFNDIIYELSDFMFGDQDILTNDRLRGYKNGVYFKPKPYVQYQYLFEFISKLENALPPIEAKRYISEVKTIFDKYCFSVFGGKAKNPFYNDARFIAYSIPYILTKYKIVDSLSIDSLKDNFFLDSYRLQFFYSALGKNTMKAYYPSDHPVNPIGYVIDSLRKKIKESLDAKQYDIEKNEITQATKDLILAEIGVLLDDYDIKTQNYWNWFKMFTKGDVNENYLRNKGLNTDFLLELVFSNNLLSQLEFKVDLGGLLLGDRGDSGNRLGTMFLYQDRPNLASLLNIEFIVSKWTRNDFEDLSRRTFGTYEIRVSDNDVIQAKMAVLKVIDDYIKSRGYIIDNFKRYGVQYTQKDILPEYNLIEALFTFTDEYEYSSQFNNKLVKEVKVSQTFVDVVKFFGIETLDLLQSLRRGGFFSPKSIEAIMAAIQQKFQEEFGYLYLVPEGSDTLTEHENYIIGLYSALLAELSSYINQRGLNLFASDSDSIRNQYDREKFYDERVIGYDVVFHLAQFLGFDPLFFEPLKPEIFTRGQWIRHHFRDWIFRNTSSTVSDILLTDKEKHTAYEQYSEGFIVAIMNSLIEVINMKKEALIETDLKDALEKYMGKYLNDMGGTTKEGNSIGALVDKVFSIWKGKGQSAFIKNLQELMRRKDTYLTTGEYENFLLLEYGMGPESRFVKNAKDFHILLQNPEISQAIKDLYATQQDFDYMERIIPISGRSTQARITDFIFIYSTHTSRQFQIEYIKWLEQVIWKI